MKSSKRIVFEISKESSLDKAVEILETYNREAEKKTALLFAEWILKKVDIILSDFLDESWFDEWKNNNNE